MPLFPHTEFPIIYKCLIRAVFCPVSGACPYNRDTVMLGVVCNLSVKRKESTVLVTLHTCFRHLCREVLVLKKTSVGGIFEMDVKLQ